MATIDDTVRDQGRERRRRAQGKKADTLQSILASFDSGMASYADEFIFGQVWGRPGLSFEERMLVAITALAAGEHSNQLRNYLHGALQDGIPASKIHEIVVMLCVYCGFPTALEAMMEWQSVLTAARKQGIPIDIDEA
ncbi:MAG TPA: carboxymuconolactone decarboxylase family protein [Acidimicrobiales bacterium]|nr:carboxymuconolactone decarboxylase family protein [Acidimicrobiales bacterium]